MTFGFHPEAETEFKDAVAFYEDRAEGLGLDFAAEVRETIERALAMPLAWVEIEPGKSEFDACRKASPNLAPFAMENAASFSEKARRFPVGMFLWTLRVQLPQERHKLRSHAEAWER